jgi:hypothetical protein
VIIAVRARPPGADWLVLVCDVGQGSGAVINLGQGRGLVVDTGKEAKPIDTCLDDSGIEEFDLLISHFDADHFAGYVGTTWGRRIDRMFVSVNVAASPEARRVATDTGAEVVPAQRGRRLAVDGAAVDVLWPPPRPQPGHGDEELRNEDSLVVRIEQEGLSTLVPGDVGAEEQYVLAQGMRRSMCSSLRTTDRPTSLRSSSPRRPRISGWCPSARTATDIRVRSRCVPSDRFRCCAPTTAVRWPSTPKRGSAPGRTVLRTAGEAIAGGVCPSCRLAAIGWGPW